MHSQQKGEGLGGSHLEDERNHEREGGRAADAGKQADAKTEAHADQHQAEGFPLKNQKESVDEGVEHRWRFSCPGRDRNNDPESGEDRRDYSSSMQLVQDAY